MPTVEVNPSSQGARADHLRVLRVVNAAAHDAVDVDVKLGVLGQELQLLVQHLQALFRDFVGHDVVDRDLQVLQAGAVEALDALRGEQVAIGDHSRDHPVAADAGDDLVEFGVQQGFAAADGNDGGAEGGQVVEPLIHDVERHRFREVVVLVAIGTRKVAAAHGDDVRQNRMVAIGQPVCNHSDLAKPAACCPPPPRQTLGHRHSGNVLRLQHIRPLSPSKCQRAGLRGG